MHPLEPVIEEWFAKKNTFNSSSVTPSIKEAIEEVIRALDKGILRVAEKKGGVWHTYEWIKKAVLLFFLIHDNELYEGSAHRYYDKIPTKFLNWSSNDFKQSGIRAVPGAIVRYGAYLGKNTVVMPSYTNIGAYVDEFTMIDSSATVGSCAQIGKHVHLSSSVVIGGVLEPPQATPTIIEDNCFIGASSAIVEGIIVEEGAVIGMGVLLSQSTRIYDRKTGKISYGRIPAGSVVVPGNLTNKDDPCSLYCAVIVKAVDAKTRSKVGINELLRNL